MCYIKMHNYAYSLCGPLLYSIYPLPGSIHHCKPNDIVPCFCSILF